ncbi:MAG: metal-dependent hydrolase [Planctomycetota bacterium]
MFAINHAAAALVIKRKYPTVPLVWLLISVQLMELVWVAFNYFGIERTTTSDTVSFVGDIHLTHMPWSHSVVTTLGVAVLAWLVLGKGLGKAKLGVAVGIGIASHLVLDLLTHQPDLQLAPFVSDPKLGLGMYGVAPLAAFAFELGFGIWCWWYYGGGKALLAAIVLFNVANISLFAAAIPGPEAWLAHRPTLITTVIFVQIVATLTLVGYLASRTQGPSAEAAAATGSAV